MAQLCRIPTLLENLTSARTLGGHFRLFFEDKDSGIKFDAHAIRQIEAALSADDSIIRRANAELRANKTRLQEDLGLAIADANAAAEARDNLARTNAELTASVEQLTARVAEMTKGEAVAWAACHVDGSVSVRTGKTEAEDIARRWSIKVQPLFLSNAAELQTLLDRERRMREETRLELVKAQKEIASLREKLLITRLDRDNTAGDRDQARVSIRRAEGDVKFANDRCDVVISAARVAYGLIDHAHTADDESADRLLQAKQTLSPFMSTPPRIVDWRELATRWERDANQARESARLMAEHLRAEKARAEANETQAKYHFDRAQVLTGHLAAVADERDAALARVKVLEGSAEPVGVLGVRDGKPHTIGFRNEQLCDGDDVEPLYRHPPKPAGDIAKAVDLIWDAYRSAKHDRVLDSMGEMQAAVEALGERAPWIIYEGQEPPKAAPKPSGEPVAWRYTTEGIHQYRTYRQALSSPCIETPLYEAPPPAAIGVTEDAFAATWKSDHRPGERAIHPAIQRRAEDAEAKLPGAKGYESRVMRLVPIDAPTVDVAAIRTVIADLRECFPTQTGEQSARILLTAIGEP